MAMGQTSGSVASGTGMMGVTVALGTVIQMLLWAFFDHASITDEQSDALALLMYPFIHLLYAKIGYNPNPPGTTVSSVETTVKTVDTPAAETPKP